MGVLERWDERNQAWADRKRAEPVKPLRLPFSGFFLVVGPVFWTAFFVSSLIHGAWLSAALYFPGVLLLPLLGWGWIRERRQ
jgi:hypothetical protein